jgi:hypothetical protein
LFRLSFEHNFVAILHAFLDFHSQSLHIVYHLATLAVRAVRGIDLSSATASIAVSLHLHLHAKADLNLLHDDTLAIALGALLGLAILRTRPATLRTIHITLYGHVS